MGAAMSSPVCFSNCADCGIDTIEAEEFYMVHDHVWEQAWGQISRGTPGEQILCIGCLGRRIGRTLTCRDFTDVPLNDPFARVQSASERLFNRLIAKQPLLPNDMATLDDYLAWRDIERLPEKKDERDAAWRAWKESRSLADCNAHLEAHGDLDD
jgi:hypothetical protein